MADCSLAITVDGWQADGDVAPTFRLGEPITGTVHVWVTDEVRCNSLEVRLELQRTAKGYQLPSGPAPVRLFSGKWPPGEYDYRFELPSTFPPSRQGRYVGWAWVVAASVDVPWAMDPKSEAPFVLAPAATQDELRVRTPPPDAVAAGETSADYRGYRFVRVLFALSLLALGVGVVLKLFGLAADPVSGPIAGFGTVASVATGLAFISMWWGRRSGGNRWQSSVELTCTTPQVGYRSSGRASGSVRCDVKTRGGGAIERVLAQLVVREYVRWTQRNTNTKSTTIREYEKVFSRVEVPLEGDSATGLWSGELPLPELDPEVPPYTLFDDQGRGLVWQVNVLSYAKDRAKPDVESRYLTVGPEQA